LRKLTKDTNSIKYSK